MEFPEQFRTLIVNETSDLLQVPVRRTFGTYGEVSVFIYSQTTRNALLGLDYTFTAQELRFLSGENLKTVNVTILGDDIPEADEVFELVLASPKGGVALGEHHSARITIAENDGAGGVVQFASEEAITVQESFSLGDFSTSVDIQLIRGPGLFGDIEVAFVVLDLLGNVTADITPSSGTITFLDLQETAVISLSVVDDHIPEFSESFVVKLSAQFEFLIGDIAEKEITILASDAPNGLLTISTLNRTEVNVEEEDSIVTCQVHRSGGLLGNVAVTVETVSQTASARPGSNFHIAPLQVFDFGATGYCSYGSYLLALNVYNSTLPGSSLQSQLLKWDGVYRHLSYIESGIAMKCEAFFMANRTHFAVINRGLGLSLVDSHIYVIADDDSIEVLHTVRTKSPINASLYMSGDSVYLAVITSEVGVQPRFALESYEILPEGVDKKDEFVLSSTAAITTFANLAIISQEENVKVYNTMSVSWTLQQTILVRGVISSAVGVFNGRSLLLLALEDSVNVYELDGSSFTRATEIPQAGVQAITGARLGNDQLYIVQTSSGVSLVRWNGASLAELWGDNSTDHFVPLVAPRLTSDSLVLARTGDMCSVSAVAKLSQPDYLPRYAKCTIPELLY